MNIILKKNEKYVIMDELSKAFTISYSGQDQDRILSEFNEQIKVWDIAMPKQPPLVLDFGLEDFFKTGLIEFWIANEIKAGYCAKYLFLFSGQTCPMHQHRNKTETFFVVKGIIEVRYSGKLLKLYAGDSLFIETNNYHEIRAVGPALFLEVSTPCLIDDNYFKNRSIPIGGNFAG